MGNLTIFGIEELRFVDGHDGCILFKLYFGILTDFSTGMASKFDPAWEVTFSTA